MPKCVPCGEKNKVKKPKTTPNVDTSQDKLDYIKNITLYFKVKY